MDEVTVSYVRGKPVTAVSYVGSTPVTVRDLTPPDFSASGNRVVVSMEDVNLGKQRCFLCAKEPCKRLRVSYMFLMFEVTL